MKYDSPGGAAAYRGKYARSWLRRLSHGREMALVRRALARAGAAGGRVLDCPGGAGRLLPLLAPFARQLVAADRARAMVLLAREAAPGAGHLVAAVPRLPFLAKSFDVAVCHRLIHHFRDEASRLAVLRELARVTRGAVVVSFQDAGTLKARWFRGRGRSRSRHLLAQAALTREARECGLEQVGAALRLNGLFSTVAVAVFRNT
ncbi:MAG: class I SAM-dependent methyltransferase [Planctomycetaceae bacterium]